MEMKRNKIVISEDLKRKHTDVAPTAVTYGLEAGKVGLYPQKDVFLPMTFLLLAPSSPLDTKIVVPIMLNFRAIILNESLSPFVTKISSKP